MSVARLEADLRDRITMLLREGSILRVKKGQYVFGERLRKRPVSRELLSNLLYGPSYVSREYALRYHGIVAFIENHAGRYDMNFAA